MNEIKRKIRMFQCRDCGSTQVYRISASRYDANTGLHIEALDDDHETFGCSDCHGDEYAIFAPAEPFECESCGEAAALYAVLVHDRPDGSLVALCDKCGVEAQLKREVA